MRLLPRPFESERAVFRSKAAHEEHIDSCEPVFFSRTARSSHTVRARARVRVWEINFRISPAVARAKGSHESMEMGCAVSTSSYTVLTATTLRWPVYMLRRTEHRIDYYTLEVFSPARTRVLVVTVQLWTTERSTLSQKALHPANVVFSVGEQQLPPPPGVDAGLPQLSIASVHGDERARESSESAESSESVPLGQASLAYIPRKRLLGGLRTYTRTVSKMPKLFEAGSSDTLWTSELRVQDESAAVSAGVLLLPSELAVLNADERVRVYRGRRPADAAEESARAADLLAWVPTKIDGGWGRGPIEVRVHPVLHEASEKHAPVLQLFLAIALEGFWSQGAASLGLFDTARGLHWTSKINPAADGPPPAVREGKNLFKVLQDQSRKEQRSRYQQQQQRRQP